MTKKEARQQIKDKIKQLDKQYIKEADQSIFDQIKELKEYKEAETIFCYASMENEVDTWPLIALALDQGKTVGVPLCIGKGIMEVRQIKTLADFECKVLPKEQIDMAVIPCVGADKEGHRLGHGAGFYDRFLRGTQFPKIMICYRKLLLDKVPIEEHDILMDRVIYDR